MVNLVHIEGLLERDADLRYTPAGNAVCSFAISNDYVFRGRDGVESEHSTFRVEAWRKLAEKCHSFRKGDALAVEGRLKEVRWTAPSGESRSVVNIVATSVDLMKNEKS